MFPSVVPQKGDGALASRLPYQQSHTQVAHGHSLRPAEPPGNISPKEVGPGVADWFCRGVASAPFGSRGTPRAVCAPSSQSATLPSNEHDAATKAPGVLAPTRIHWSHLELCLRAPDATISGRYPRQSASRLPPSPTPEHPKHNPCKQCYVHDRNNQMKWIAWRPKSEHRQYHSKSHDDSRRYHARYINCHQLVSTEASTWASAACGPKSHLKDEEQSGESHVYYHHDIYYDAKCQKKCQGYLESRNHTSSRV